MTEKINIHAKSRLAKLMAFENVFVDYDPTASTASFDIASRTVTLPILKDMSGHTHDAFLAHEVSHALHTPADVKVIEKAFNEVPKDFINVTEDARIERLIEQKYPGTKKDFFGFYDEFSMDKKDMFELKGKDLEKDYTLIDKINLHFKPGRYSFIKVPFTQEEQKYVDMVDNQKTFEDAVASAKAILEYMKVKGEVIEVQTQEGGMTADKDGKGKKGQAQFKPGKGKQAPGATQRAFDKNFKDGQVDQSKKDVQFGDALSSLDVESESMIDKSVLEKLKSQTNEKIYAEFLKFITDTTPTINMMVSYFNMKKAAREYQKTATSKTGKLDMSEIMYYKLKDDVFLRNELVAEEKNHGFVFFIDWSGSMQSNIFATFKQLLILLEFCRKVQIPFEVYGFTTGQGTTKFKPAEIPKNKIVPDMRDNLVFKMLGSDMPSYEYKKNINNIFGMLQRNPQEIKGMGGTPIYNTALISDMIMEKFKQKYKREKTILVLLSDGANGDQLFKNGKSAAETIVRNPLTGDNYKINTYHDMFKYVKDKNEITKMVGFFITDRLSSGDIGSLIGDYKPYEKGAKLDAKLAEFAKERYTVFTEGPAFNKYFAIDMSNFSDTSVAKNLSEVKDGKQADEAFRKQLMGTMNKMIFLKTFIEEIA